MITINTDKNQLDIELIHDYLSNKSYWAKGRSIETVRKSIKHSLCFGVYKNNEQIGFAKVITDFTIFAWLLDVFIIDEYQKKGIGKKLMTTIMNHHELQNLRRWGLATNDAHDLYKKYGFKSSKRPEILMEIVSNRSE